MSTSAEGPIGRRDECQSCGADLHACAQCRFYDPAASNQCREPQAERVQAKERANFCDFFQFSTAKGGSADRLADEAKQRLAALFKR